MAFENLFTGQQSLHSILFTPRQLRQILAAYSEGVLKKGWKDYALDSSSTQSVFSVIDHQGDQGSVALYSFSANKPKSKNKDRCFYRVFHRENQILRTESFLEALEFFRTLDGKGDSKGPKGKKAKKALRIID